MSELDVVICTVGNSLYNDIAIAIESGALRETEEALDIANEVSFCAFVKQLPDGDQLCGAEIRSLSHLVTDGYLRKHASALELIVQNTDRGRLIGRAIRHREEGRMFKSVTVHSIVGLQDLDYDEFTNVGLQNLLLKIASLVRYHNLNGSRVGIVATGGLKAQVAFATLVGQLFQTPVFYLSKEFQRIVKLPPMPIAPDVNLWLENVSLFWELDGRSSLLSESDLCDALGLDNLACVDPRIYNLLERIEEADEDGEPVAVYALSAVGVLFNDYCASLDGLGAPNARLRSRSGIGREVASITLASGEAGHRPSGTEAYVRSIAERADFVTSIAERAFENGKPSKRVRFKPVWTGSANQSYVTGFYSHRENDSKYVRLCIHTTARNLRELIVAARTLNEMFQ
ncbi:MAG: putative CRISPR-associated protein [bacterium]|nr:putative CRISPR-associated protein [bacterium]